MPKLTDPEGAQRFTPPVFVGSLFLSGFAPVMRGTCGTLVAVGFGAILLWAGAGDTGWWIGAAMFAALSLWIAAVVLKMPGAPADPDWFVLDEAAGLFLTLALIRAGTPLEVLAGFLSFRCYDIAKPWPVSSFERLKGTWGILLDDLAAGVLAAWTVWAISALGQDVF